MRSIASAFVVLAERDEFGREEFAMALHRVAHPSSLDPHRNGTFVMANLFACCPEALTHHLPYCPAGLGFVPAGVIRMNDCEIRCEGNVQCSLKDGP